MGYTPAEYGVFPVAEDGDKDLRTKRDMNEHLSGITCQRWITPVYFFRGHLSGLCFRGGLWDLSRRHPFARMISVRHCP